VISYSYDQFFNLFDRRQRLLTHDNTLMLEFKKEMHRFLLVEQINKTLEQGNLWAFIVYLMGDLGTQLHQNLAD